MRRLLLSFLILDICVYFSLADELYMGPEIKIRTFYNPQLSRKAFVETGYPLPSGRLQSFHYQIHNGISSSTGSKLVIWENEGGHDYRVLYAQTHEMSSTAGSYQVS